MCCYRSPLVSVVALKLESTVQCSDTRGVVGSLVIVLLKIFSWFWQWKKFENWPIFDEVKAYEKMCQFFWATLYVRDPSCLQFARWRVRFSRQIGTDRETAEYGGVGGRPGDSTLCNRSTRGRPQNQLDIRDTGAEVPCKRRSLRSGHRQRANQRRRRLRVLRRIADDHTGFSGRHR